MKTTSVLEDIKAERARQEAIWGEQNHDPERLEAVYKGVEWASYREELVHIAAVAVAAIESYDRQPPK